MKNNRNSIIIVAIVAVVAIAGVSIYAISRNDNMMDGDMMGNSNSQSAVQADTSSADYKQYAALKGEDYDKMFLANMIAHHQGAVDMANLALTTAIRGCSSVVRALPCQGRGRELESLHPHQISEL